MLEHATTTDAAPIGEALLTYRQVADYAGVTERQVFNWCNREGLPHFKLGRNVRIRPEDLRTWLADRYTINKAGDSDE